MMEFTDNIKFQMVTRKKQCRDFNITYAGESLRQVRSSLFQYHRQKSNC